MRKLLCLLAVACVAYLWSAAAAAQTKIEWSDNCAQADPDYTLQVGDRPAHSFGLSQIKCQPSKPVEIGADKGKEAVATIASDSSGGKSREHGVYVLTLESGDKVSLPFQGTIALKDGKPTGSRGTWTFAEGTGKLKEIKGKGTFHCSPAPSGGGWSCGGEGQYELAK
jgi:hypothetical protein